ncbi:MAG: hypothetical protein Q8M56_10235 [Desulfobacterales bacterium]|nr:hypothetical protein [Desulfobacterales bacterium]
MRKKECFTSLQPCDRQSELNDADEPPSLFIPFSAGTGLNRLFKTPFSTVPVSRDLPMLSLSKKHFFPKIKSFPFPVNKLVRELPESADVFFETEGFILRDKRGRIKTIIFKQKRSM